MGVSRKVQMGSGQRNSWSLDDVTLQRWGSGKNNLLSNEDFPFSNNLCHGIVFNNDGTLGIVQTYNEVNNNVYFQDYTLTSAYDLSTASAPANTTTVDNLSSVNLGFAVNSSGTIFFVMTPTAIYSYTFSVAWDISSTITENSYSLTGSSAWAFNDDGTRLYVWNQTNDEFDVYDLNTAWDLTDTITQGTSIGTGTVTGLDNLSGMAFSSDGLVLYITDKVGAAAWRTLGAFTLSTAYDVSTLDDTSYTESTGQLPDYAGDAITVVSTSTEVRMFSGAEDNGVICLLANEGPDATTNPASFKTELYSRLYNPGQTSSFIIYPRNIQSISFNDDGSEMFLFRQGSLFKDTLSETYAVSSSDYSATSISSETNADYVNYKWFNSGSNTFYYRESGYAEIQTVSTPYDVSTVTSTTSATFSTLASRALSYANGATLNDSGTKITFTVLDTALNDSRTDPIPFPRSIASFPMSVAYDLTTIDYSGLHYFRLSGDYNGLAFNSDGSSFFTYDDSDNELVTFSPLTNYGMDVVSNPTTLTSFFDLDSLCGKVEDIAFSNNGLSFFSLSTDDKTIRSYALSSAFDASPVSSVSTPPKCFLPITINRPLTDLTFNPTGTKLFVLTTNYVLEYSLSTAFDLSTATYTTFFNGITYDSSTQSSLAWGDSGTKLYVLRHNAQSLEEFSASTAYDISTLSSTPTNTVTFGTFTIGTSTKISSMHWKPDGSRLFFTAISNSSNTEYIFEFSFSTAWNSSTINSTTTPVDSVELGLTNDDIFGGLYFDSTGDTLVFIYNKNLYKYSLSTAWDLSSTLTNLQEIPLSYMPGGNGPNTLRGLFISSDSQKVVFGTSSTLSNGTFNRVSRLDLSSALDFETATYDGGANAFVPFRYVTVGGNKKVVAASIEQMRFLDNGTKLYVLYYSSALNDYPGPVYETGYHIAQFTLSPAYDLSSALYVTSGGITINGTSALLGLECFDISENGEEVLFVENGEVYKASLTTSYDISTMGTGSPLSVGGLSAGDLGLVDSTDCRIIRWTSDGTGIYTSNSVDFLKFGLSTAYDLSTASWSFPEQTLVTANAAGIDGDGISPIYGDSGSYFYFIDTASGTSAQLRSYVLSTPFDVSTATEGSSLQILNSLYDFTNSYYKEGLGLEWRPNGDSFYVSLGPFIAEYKC